VQRLCAVLVYLGKVLNSKHIAPLVVYINTGNILGNIIP